MGKSRINRCQELQTEFRSGTWAKRIYLERLLSSCRAPLTRNEPQILTERHAGKELTLAMIVSFSASSFRTFSLLLAGGGVWEGVSPVRGLCAGAPRQCCAGRARVASEDPWYSIHADSIRLRPPLARSSHVPGERPTARLRVVRPGTPPGAPGRRRPPSITFMYLTCNHHERKPWLGFRVKPIWLTIIIKEAESLPCLLQLIAACPQSG